MAGKGKYTALQDVDCEYSTTVYVGPYLYELRWFNGLRDKYKRVGECQPDLFVIWIDSTIPPERQRMVAVHELLHAVADLAGPPTEEEEDTVNRWAPPIWSLYRDNPYFMDWVCSDTPESFPEWEHRLSTVATTPPEGVA